MPDLAVTSPAVTVGLDVGTSALKASIYGLGERRIVENLTFKYGETELSVGVSRLERYLDAIIRAIVSLDTRYTVTGVALSTQMYSFLADVGGERLVYQWNSSWPTSDVAAAQLDKANAVSGCPVATLFPAYKILAARETDPGLAILPYGLQDALCEALTGERAVDHCYSSSSGFRDVVNGGFNADLLAAAGWSPTDMSPIRLFNEPIGTITHPSIRTKAPITFALGLGDGPSASYASWGTSRITANVGTSMAVRAFVDDVSDIDFRHVWTFGVEPGRWVAGAISANGCAVLDHHRSIGYLDDGELDLRGVDNSLQYFPWMGGERSPFWSDALRQTLIGGKVNSTREDYAAAIVRGVAFTLTRLYHEVAKVNAATDMLCVAGGGARFETLLTYLAGSIPVPIGLLQDFDYLGSCGAAYVAAEAIGVSPVRNHEMYKTYQPTGEFDAEYAAWVDTADSLNSWYAQKGLHK